MSLSRRRLLIWASALSATSLSATSLARAQQAPMPVRPLGRIEATIKESFARVPVVRQLSDGRLLVNDAGYAHVYLYDAALTHFITVPLPDSTGRFAEMIGTRPYGLLSYLGDSTLFVDQRSIAFLVVDPSGRIARVIAPPRPRDLMYFGQTGIGNGTFDGSGHLVYFPMPLVRYVHTSGGDSTMAPPDSAPLIRLDLRTAAVDTIARLSLASNSMMSTGGNGMVAGGVHNPIPIGDAWAMLPGGTIAVIRAQDYHIDWISLDGTRRATPKIPHQWIRITDSVKVAVLDSTREADSLMWEGMLAKAGRGGSGGSAAKAGGNGAVGGGGAGASSPSVGNRPTVATLMAEGVYADPSALPDYRPAFIGTAEQVDPEGRIWILTDQPRASDGGPIYDVVDRMGKLVDRIQIPGGCTLIGFGPGVVYLTSREGTGVSLARARIR